MKDDLMNNRQVAQAFINGATSGKSLHMFIDGDTIYSYGYHFAIATRQSGDHFPLTNVTHTNIYLVNANRYSATTAKHRSHVIRAIGGAPYIEALGNRELSIDLEYLRGKYSEWLAKAKRARTAGGKYSAMAWANEYQRMIQLVNSL